MFTKTQALLLGSLFIAVLIVFHLSERVRGSSGGVLWQPKRGLEYGAYREGFTQEAPECVGAESGPLYYPEGQTKEEQCVEQCPAPTLPDVQGRCTGDIMSA